MGGGHRALDEPPPTRSANRTRTPRAAESTRTRAAPQPPQSSRSRGRRARSREPEQASAWARRRREGQRGKAWPRHALCNIQVQPPVSAALRKQEPASQKESVLPVRQELA